MRRDMLLWVVLAILGVACLILVLNHDGQVAGLADDQFASLVYFGAWGLVLASSALLMFRTRLGTALKAAAIWGLAFLVLIGLYASAPELNALKNRVMAALVPGSVVAVAGSDRTQFMATRGVDNHFHLAGSIDGAPVSFMVDTGASVVAMDRATAEKLGISTGNLRFSQRVMTANGVANAAPLRLDTVRIGDIVRHDVEAAVIEGEGLGVVLLGMSFLSTLTSFDFRGDRLILTE